MSEKLETVVPEQAVYENVVRRIVVKFDDNIDIPYEDNAQHLLPEKLAEYWSMELPEVPLNRLYTSLSPVEIQRLAEEAAERDPSYNPPNFLTFFAAVVPDGRDPEEVVAALSGLEEIEYAYVESPPAPPPDVPAGSNIRLNQQRYLLAPTVGVAGAATIGGINVYNSSPGAPFVWQQPGSSGQGVTFVDIEKGWVRDHPDLLDAAGNPLASLVDGINLNEKAHGTSVLGILLSQDNNVGGVGIASKATAKLVSPWQLTETDDLVWNIPNAIKTAAAALSFGDVILLEVQIWRGGILAPVELEKAIYEEILEATSLGITVIEAAGNGGTSLASLPDTDGLFTLNPASSDFKQSRAVMVSAATPLGNQAKRRGSSNFGTRVDCFSWGERVNTTTDPSSGGGYTSNFAGTSSAAAIVAGAAMVIQGMARQLGPPLNASTMRSLLRNRDLGTHSNDLATDQIGVMPNVRALVEHQFGITF